MTEPRRPTVSYRQIGPSSFEAVPSPEYAAQRGAIDAHVRAREAFDALEHADRATDPALVGRYLAGMFRALAEILELSADDGAARAISAETARDAVTMIDRGRRALVAPKVIAAQRRAALHDRIMKQAQGRSATDAASVVDGVVSLTALDPLSGSLSPRLVAHAAHVDACVRAAIAQSHDDARRRVKRAAVAAQKRYAAAFDALCAAVGLPIVKRTTRAAAPTRTARKRAARSPTKR